MLNASLVDATVEGFPSPSITNHVGKPYCITIKEIHHLLTGNVVLVQSDLGGGHNSYLGIILPPKQYTCISKTAFFPPAPPGKNGNRPSMDSAWRGGAPPKRTKGGAAQVLQLRGGQLLPEKKVRLRLRRPLPAHTEKSYTGYATKITLELIQHIYTNYAHLSSTDMSANDNILRYLYNAEEPIKGPI